MAHEPRRAGGRQRRRRIVAVVIGLVVVIAALAIAKVVQISSVIAAAKKMQKAGPPPESVSVMVAQKQTWDETLDTVGSVTSSRGVSITNDAPGIVSKIDFESGATVRKGQVLLELSSAVERAQLASARAHKDLAQTTADRTRALAASGSVPPAQLDTDDSQLVAASADAQALRAQIERKIVRAPFAGKLGIRLVNLGQFLAPGTPIVMLESTEGTFVDFTLPQQELGRVAVGMLVRLSFDGADAGAAPPVVEGSVFALDPAVDPVTRSIRLRASLPNAGVELRPGMFVNVAVVEPSRSEVVTVPATAVVHASYGDSVFVVEGADGSQTARQQFVRIGRTRGDFVAVTQGVQAGERVVVAGAFKLRNRARVAVTKELAIHPELSPHPPNR